MAVADGVSGYQAAGVASQMAVDVTLGSFREQDAGAKLEVRLARAAQQANIAIYDKALAVPELRGMATTLTAIAIESDYLAVAHVGDSRLYLVREGRALQLTKDHRSGKTALTRCVGRELIVAVDRISRRVQTGDLLVLCTDGLHNVLSDAEIGTMASRGASDEACRSLFERALAAGADDNVTVAVTEVLSAAPARAAAEGLGEKLLRLVGQR